MDVRIWFEILFFNREGFIVLLCASTR